MPVRSSSHARRLIAANGVWAAGLGMVIPITLIYLHRVRGIPISTTGLLLGLAGVHRPGFPLVAALALLLAVCGYAAVDSGVPAYGNVVARVSPSVVALGLTVNTAVIVVLQLVVLRLLRGRRQTRALVVTGVVWAGSWLLLGLSHLPRSVLARSVMVVAFDGLFGVGETFMQPALFPLVNRLAGEDLLGRANAVTGGSLAVAFAISPALAGGAVAAGLSSAWIGYLVAVSLGVGVLAVVLGRRIGPTRDGGAAPRVPDAEPTATRRLRPAVEG